MGKVEKVEAAAVVLDVALGLLASEMAVAPADWSRVCLDRSARAWRRAVDLEVDDDVAAASAAVEGELWESLALSRPAVDVVARLGDLFDDFPVGRWGCPDCVDDDGAPVVLSYLGGGVWSCPACGCSTSSPVDDACVDLRGGDCGGALVSQSCGA